MVANDPATTIERMILPGGLEELSDHLLEPNPDDDIFGSCLTVIKALGQPVVAQTIINPAAERQMLLRSVARERSGALMISMHVDWADGRRARGAQGVLTGECEQGCYSYRLTDREVVGEESLRHIFGDTAPHAVAVRKAEEVMARMATAHPESDFFSRYGFSFSQFVPIFGTHNLSPAMTEAITQVHDMRASVQQAA